MTKKNYYKVSFYYDGSGEIIIEAKSKAEAREIFMQGDWNDDEVDDTSDNYVVEDVNKV